MRSTLEPAVHLRPSVKFLTIRLELLRQILTKPARFNPNEFLMRLILQAETLHRVFADGYEDWALLS